MVSASGDISDSDDGYINIGQMSALIDDQRSLEDASRSKEQMLSRAQVSLSRRTIRREEIVADVKRYQTSVAFAMSENEGAMSALKAALDQSPPLSDVERQRLTSVLNASVAKVERRSTRLDKYRTALVAAEEALAKAVEEYHQLLLAAAPGLEAKAKAGEAQPEAALLAGAEAGEVALEAEEEKKVEGVAEAEAEAVAQAEKKVEVVAEAEAVAEADADAKEEAGAGAVEAGVEEAETLALKAAANTKAKAEEGAEAVAKVSAATFTMSAPGKGLRSANGPLDDNRSVTPSALVTAWIAAGLPTGQITTAGYFDTIGDREEASCVISFPYKHRGSQMGLTAALGTSSNSLCCGLQLPHHPKLPRLPHSPRDRWEA